MAHRQKTVRSDAEIETILAERVAAQGPGIAIVVRIIHPSGLRVIAQGEPAATGNRAVKSDTLFEIGSLTKVFTALLLTDMAARGHVTITDPVAKYLPPNARSPARFGRAISLADPCDAHVESAVHVRTPGQGGLLRLRVFSEGPVRLPRTARGAALTWFCLVYSDLGLLAFVGGSRLQHEKDCS